MSPAKAPLTGISVNQVRCLTLTVLVTLSCATARPADWVGSPKLDVAINGAIADGLTPGAVALIESRGRTLHFASYGSRSVEPQREEMTIDTIFDCASLTKVMATAPAVMMLVEEGKVRLQDRVQQYLPEFRSQERVTIQQLLTHYSGLRPTLDLEPPWSGYEHGISLALNERPVRTPGSQFVYSDINYILLAEIVKRTSGKALDQFVRERVFEPLGMHDTMFAPPVELRNRIAPTEKLSDGTILRGIVHDPTTRMMGGVSGQAGVFSTASDVARFARMMLNGGELEGVRVLSPLSVLRMRTPQSPPGKDARGIGWDIDTPYSSPRGDLFGTASYGHTGYTGPSLWIDPVTDSFVALMTNRVHPRVGTSVVRLRSIVASITAANLDVADTVAPRGEQSPSTIRESTSYTEVQTGLDRLVADGFAVLRGKRVGLLTNHTGIDRLARRNIDLMHRSEHVNLRRVFTPEHGIDGTLDQPRIADGLDSRTGVEVVSLYQGERRRPPRESLDGLDALVFDVQDIGSRFYTYITTMGYAMEAAAQAGIEFYVLDRPNPINGVGVEGPILETSLESFVGYHALPIRHGMTVGELARMFNEERGIGADLMVVEMQGWRRSLWFDETGLPWVNPSPNIRTLDQATLYPGIAMLEWLSDYSVGRGTDTPFQFVGADWIDGTALASAIRKASLPGIRVYSRKQLPHSSVFEGTVIDGIQFTITDRDKLQPTLLGLVIASALKNLYAERIEFDKTEKLIGNRAAVEQLNQGVDALSVAGRQANSLNEFRARRHRYLLY